MSAERRAEQVSKIKITVHTRQAKGPAVMAGPPVSSTALIASARCNNRHQFSFAFFATVTVAESDVEFPEPSDTV